MKRVCFIGDSHVAALKLALNTQDLAAISDRMGVFGVRGAALANTFIEDGILTSDDPEVRDSLRFTGGDDSIHLDAYDIFCVVGCRVSYKVPLKLLAGYSSYTMGLPNRQLVSEPLLDSLVINRFKASLAATVVNMLAAATDKPIYLLPNPLWSPVSLDFARGGTLGEIVKLGHADIFADWVFNNLQSAFVGKATVLQQPEHTRLDSVFTHPRYSSGSIRLKKKSVAHPDNDFNHMNAAYGKAVIQALFAEIDKEPQDIFARYADTPGREPASLPAPASRRRSGRRD